MSFRHSFLVWLLGLIQGAVQPELAQATEGVLDEALVVDVAGHRFRIRVDELTGEAAA